MTEARVVPFVVSELRLPDEEQAVLGREWWPTVAHAVVHRADLHMVLVSGNADLWTAPLYYLLGIPIPMYTPLFAASRVAGWAAHYLETRYVNAEPILRPRAEYVGPPQRQFDVATAHAGFRPFQMAFNASVSDRPR